MGVWRGCWGAEEETGGKAEREAGEGVGEEAGWAKGAGWTKGRAWRGEEGVVAGSWTRPGVSRLDSVVGGMAGEGVDSSAVRGGREEAECSEAGETGRMGATGRVTGWETSVEERGNSRGTGAEMGSAWSGGGVFSEVVWASSVDGFGKTETREGTASGAARITWGRGNVAGRRVCKTSVRGGRRAEARGMFSGVEGVSWRRRVLSRMVTRREEASKRVGGTGMPRAWCSRVAEGREARWERRRSESWAAFSARSAGGGRMGSSRRGAEMWRGDGARDRGGRSEEGGAGRGEAGEENSSSEGAEGEGDGRDEREKEEGGRGAAGAEIGAVEAEGWRGEGEIVDCGKEGWDAGTGAAPATCGEAPEGEGATGVEGGVARGVGEERTGEAGRGEGVEETEGICSCGGTEGRRGEGERGGGGRSAVETAMGLERGG